MSGHGRDPERARICSTMVALVAERGFKGLRLDDVLAAAGLGTDRFGEHFESLEDCFAAIWDEVDAELRTEMKQAFDGPFEWQDRLRESLAAGMRYLAADDARARLYVAEVLYVNDDLRDRQNLAMDRLALAVDMGREDEGAHWAPPGIAGAIAGAIWHRVRQLVQSGRSRELPGQVSRFMYLAVLPYRGSAAAQTEIEEG